MQSCKDSCYSGSFRCNKDALCSVISFVMSVLASRSGTSTILIDGIHINGLSRYIWYQSLVVAVVSRPRNGIGSHNLKNLFYLPSLNSSLSSNILSSSNPFLISLYRWT